MLEKIKSKIKNNITISVNDYQKYGCPNCNNLTNTVLDRLTDYTYKKVTCQNCQAIFTIVGKEFISNVNISEHPHKIQTIKYQPSIIIEENTNEEYCTFVKNQDDTLIFNTANYNAIKAITNWFVKLESIYKDDFTFSATTEFDNPNNPILKVKYKDFYRALALKNSIIRNQNKISYEIIKKANNMELNFKNKWNECCLFRNIFILTNIEYIQSSIKTIQGDMDIYNINSMFTNRNNIIEIFESFGIYIQTNKELEKNNLDGAARCLLHYISNINSNFSKQKYLENEKDQNIYNTVRKNLQNDLINLLNTYHEYEESYLKHLKLDNIDFTNFNVVSLSNYEDKANLKDAYINYIKPLLNRILDLNIIKKLTKYVDEPFESLTEEQNKNNNFLMFYLLCGFKLQMKLELKKDDYKNVLLTIEYVIERLNSPLYKNYLKSSEQTELKENVDKLKTNLQRIYNYFSSRGKILSIKEQENLTKQVKRKLFFKRK